MAKENKVLSNFEASRCETIQMISFRYQDMWYSVISQSIKTMLILQLNLCNDVKKIRPNAANIVFRYLTIWYGCHGQCCTHITTVACSQLHQSISRQTSNTSHTLVGNWLLVTQMKLEHRLSALLQLHLHSRLNTCPQWIWERQIEDDTRNI